MSTRIIKNTLVKVGAPAAARGVCAPRERQSARKEARAIQIDGEIRAIEFTCACGETTVVELVIDAQKVNDGGAKP